MFLGLVSALEQIELTGISNLLAGLLELSGQIVFGLVIIAVGNFLANIAYRSLSNSDEGGKTVATIARFTILGLFIAIALRTMGIANEIVTLAFGLTLGAAAVAFALAFGLGGREAAVNRWNIY
jgi:prepilin signal peptidase PulO-like enzyme (type II secretory pathway)